MVIITIVRGMLAYSSVVDGPTTPLATHSLQQAVKVNDPDKEDDAVNVVRNELHLDDHQARSDVCKGVDNLVLVSNDPQETFSSPGKERAPIVDKIACPWMASAARAVTSLVQG